MSPRPFRIKTMKIIHGRIFAVRCRPCGMTCAYMSDLPGAFEAVDRHIEHHRREAQRVEEVLDEMALESQQ